MKTITLMLLVGALAACASTDERGEMRYYTCDDGTGFNAELLGRSVKLHTATGVIELPRARSDGPGELFSNGLRSVVINADGSARQAIGKRVWANCTAG